MSKNQVQPNEGSGISALSAWGLSFGCAVGWGAFVMPATTFLPQAGPLGTVLGMLAGAFVMYLIGINFRYMMEKYPGAGGPMLYAIRTFGYDHGFLCGWFLILVYVAIIWANASALGLICKNLFGPVLQFGFHYRILNYDIYFGEVLLAAAIILACGLICQSSGRLAVGFTLLCALLLFLGVAVVSIMAFWRDGNLFSIAFATPFHENRGKPLFQILNILALSPWAFVGFESISIFPQHFRFPVKKNPLDFCLFPSDGLFMLHFSGCACRRYGDD